MPDDSPFRRVLSETDKANMLSRRRPYDQRLKNLEVVEQTENAGRNDGAEDPVKLDRYQELKSHRRRRQDQPIIDKLMGR